ncbi:MAG: Gfo/Idh/MocA family protein [Thermoproteota archaeon]
MRSSKVVHLGIVGGGFGSAFEWYHHPNCVIEAVCDYNSERRKKLIKTYNCNNAYENFEELLEDENVDAIALFTPAPYHAQHAVKCLEAGKHVLSAVPACMTLEEANLLLKTVEKTKLNYMLAETSWYHQAVISARKWFKEGKFGRIFYTEAEYYHPGLASLFFDANGNKTWRYGFPPMHYPTHSTAYLVGVTGENMIKVVCTGWGDDSSILKDNAYKNPFWNETAFFLTEEDNAFRASVYWNAPIGQCERGQWFGEKMSFFEPHPNGTGYVIWKSGKSPFDLPKLENFQQVQWWNTNVLPESLRHPTGHDSSHGFIVHEFIESILENRYPEIGIYEALAMTVPGIVAHQSALRGGQQMDIPVFKKAW